MLSSRALRSSVSLLRGVKTSLPSHVYVVKFSSNKTTTTTSHSSTTSDEMLFDKRYQSVNEVPTALTDDNMSKVIHSPGFSIKGEALEGRPAYLDFQATTPTDPRVVDAMVTCCCIAVLLLFISEFDIIFVSFFVCSCRLCLVNMEIHTLERILMGNI